MTTGHSADGGGRRKSERHGRRPVLFALLMLVAGGALVILAVPRLAAGYHLVWAAPALQAIAERQRLGKRNLIDAVDRLESAAEWIEDGRVRTDLGLFRRKLAVRVGSHSDMGKAEMTEAARQTRIGLARAPADSFAWQRLARILEASAAPPKDVLAALRMSALVGPYIPNLLRGRVEIALRHWDDHDPETRALFERQFRLAWFRVPHAMVVLSMRYGKTAEVAAILESVPGAPEDFDARLRRQIRATKPAS